MIWQKFVSYVNIFDRKHNRAKGNVNLKLMHGINRISIMMFLMALIIMLVRYVF